MTNAQLRACYRLERIISFYTYTFKVESYAAGIRRMRKVDDARRRLNAIRRSAGLPIQGGRRPVDLRRSPAL